MDKLWHFLRDVVISFLEEKYKAFRAGFFAGGAVSMPFLFAMHGFSFDLIWIFPLKLLMCCCFSYCTGLASHAAKWSYGAIAKRLRDRANKKKQQNNNP